MGFRFSEGGYLPVTVTPKILICFKEAPNLHYCRS